MKECVKYMFYYCLVICNHDYVCSLYFYHRDLDVGPTTQTKTKQRKWNKLYVNYDDGDLVINSSKIWFLIDYKRKNKVKSDHPTQLHYVQCRFNQRLIIDHSMFMCLNQQILIDGMFLCL